MFIYLRLVLAHFIGDYILQFNKIYAFKHKGVAGVLPHTLLIIYSFIALSWPYLNLPSMWGLIAFIGITHHFQDTIKVGYVNIKYSFWLYLLDQIVHIATISLGLFIFSDLKNLLPPRNTGELIISLYNSNVTILYLIAMIVATYNGFYLIRTFKTTFFGRAGASTAFEKWYELAERAIILTLFLVGGWYLLLVPLVLGGRTVIARLPRSQCKVGKNFNSLREILLSFTVAALTGICFHIIIRRIC